jgi:hypothetical protein
MKFKLWSPRYEDAVVIEGDYMDLAVEQWAETEDYTIVGSGDTYAVFVEDETGKITTYSVWGPDLIDQKQDPNRATRPASARPSPGP